MTPAILNLLTTKPAAPVPAGSSSATDAAGSGDDFGALLGGKLNAAHARLAPPEPPASGKSAAATAQATIAKLIKAGKSDGEIISALAAQLAASTAQALGATGGDVRAQLQAAFAQGLAPPGNAGGAPRSAAERTIALTQRFLEVRTLAENILSGQKSGQQNRIAGSFLDAKPAKETPALASPKPYAHPAEPPAHADGRWIPANTQGADITTGSGTPATVPASTITPAPGTVPAPVADPPNPALASAVAATNTGVLAAATGDGRSVSLGDTPAIGSGGATLLGRVLTRAALAADARQPADVQQTSTPAKAIAPSGSSPAAAFVKAFAAALGTAKTQPDLAAHPQTAGEGAALPLSGHAAAPAATAFVPAVAPFTVERSAVAAPPAPSAAPATVDQSAIVDQVLRGAFMRNTGTSSEMRLSLVPETLGDVKVQLIVTAGSVAAHVVAQTPEVRDALAAAQPQLTKSLADAGLKLASFTVDLSGNGFAGFSGHPGGQGQPGTRTPRAVGAVPDDGDDTALEAVPSFAPPAFAGGPGDYNYLV